MKPNRIVIVRIPNLGELCLIMGICRQLDEEDHWFKYQLFTMESYLKSPDSGLQQVAKKLSKYHGTEVKFDALPQPIEILAQPHSFSFKDAKQYDMTVDQRKALNEEMSTDNWVEFDWETWGK